MGKGLEVWSVKHLLMVSVALNVWLVLKLMSYERESNFTTEQIFHGFCAEEKLHKQLSPSSSSSSTSMAAAVAEKAINFLNPSTSSHTIINDDVNDDDDDVDDDGRVINLDQ